MKQALGLLFLVFHTLVEAQIDYPLPTELSEISGLEKLNDSTIIAINDSGNEALIYLLNFRGEIVRRVTISNAKNTDWEALAIDENFVYIGDLGNNLNDRKDLCIYRIHRNDLLILNEIPAEKMSISYQEQTAFPPKEDKRYFDAEAMTFFEGQLWIFTKNNTKPFDGISYLYCFQFEPNAQKVLKKTTEIKLNTRSYFKDAITSASTLGNQIILTTYNRMILLDFPKEGIRKKNLYFYPHIQQVEACVALGQNQYLLSNEKNRFLGPAKFKMLTLP